MECEIDLMANYGGSDKKRGILYNGKRYMLKMSDKIPEDKQNDRHANNWGYLVDRNTKELTLAPVYDCGSSLYPQIADDAIERILDSKEEIQKRIDVFPQAALTIRGNKVSYKGYISSFANQDCNSALLRVAPRINMNKIRDIIVHTDGISEIRKEFYMKMLLERYHQIIMEPYTRLAKANS